MHLFVSPSHLKVAIVVFCEEVQWHKRGRALSEPDIWDPQTLETSLLPSRQL